MTWPLDGEPRYVMGVMKGDRIGRSGVEIRATPEVYVYDRAFNCKLVARHFGFTDRYRQYCLEQRVQDDCHRLNDLHAATL